MAAHLDRREVGQPSDAVETALADALRAATAASQWGVVAELAAELKARREAQAEHGSAQVLSLRPRRARGQQVVDELCTASGKPAPERKTVATFRQLGEQWTSGELHKLYPDQVPLKATAADDASRLDRYAYPVIGLKPIDEVTLEDCEQIMRRIPESASRSRRHIAQHDRPSVSDGHLPVPLHQGFAVAAGVPAARQLPQGADVPLPRERSSPPRVRCRSLGYRLLWGFLAREGMREGEALALTWGDVDLDTGRARW